MATAKKIVKKAVKSKLVKKFVFGPVQRKWLNSLKKYPDSQTDGTLALIQEDGTYKACCLGELTILGAEAGLCKIHWNKNGSLYQKGHRDIGTDYPKSWKALGLHDHEGKFKNGVVTIKLNGQSKSYATLAEMNDHGMTWPEIAAYVEKNPENVFTKSF